MSEEENIQSGSEGQPPQTGNTAEGAGTGAEGQQTSPEAGAAGGAGETTAQIEKLNKKLDELSESNKSLQSQFTEVSQDAARQRELLAAVDPYIDYERMRGVSAGGGEGEGEGEETYLTSKQVEKMISDVKKGVSEQLLANSLRSKYPDIFDNGPNEILGRWFLQNKTIPTDKVENRIEQAVKLTREHLDSLKEEGKKSADEEKVKAEAEQKAREAAAAKASGLSPTGAKTTTTPKPPEEDENKPVTADEYAAERQKARLKRQNI